MKSYRQIGHTADIGLEVWGKNLKELFQNAANGMFDMIVEMSGFTRTACGGTRTVFNVSLNVTIVEELLVRWLEENLYIFGVKKHFPLEYRFKMITGNKLEAEIMAIPLDGISFKVLHDVKAVTYHNLVIEEEKGRFRTTIIFDI